VTGDFFRVLGLAPERGRLLANTDASDAHFVVLSDRAWRRNFAGDPGIVGRVIALNDVPHTVVGVLAPTLLAYPTRETDLWTVLPPDESRGSRGLGVIARLKPGVEVGAAQREAETIAARLERQFPESNKTISSRVEPLRDSLVESARPLLLILLAAAGVVLLIACANVANLMLARAVMRRRELGVRASLGAGRWRIARQLLTESAVIGLAGGAAGLGVAVGTQRLVLSLAGGELPRVAEVGMDLRVVAFAFVLSMVVGVVAGLVPALAAVRGDVALAIRDGGYGSTIGRVRRGTLAFLVRVEIGLAIVLLASAGLLLESFAKLSSVDPGFRAEGLLTFGVDVPRSRYPDRASVFAFYDRLADRLTAIPGVRAAGAVSALPFGNANWCTGVKVEGRVVPAGSENECVEIAAVHSRYLPALGARLMAGRLPDDHDGAESPLVAVINERTASRYWPGESPIGKRFAFDDKTNVEVIGVVSAVRMFGLDQEAVPQLYMPLRQLPQRQMTAALRTEGDPRLVIGAVRDAVRSLDRDLYLGGLRTMRERVAESIATPRLRSLVLGAFAAVAVLLAVVGVYGVMAFAVGQRMREMGIRVALGATAGAVTRHVLVDGVRLALAGVALGLVGSLAASRLLAKALFGVSAHDPLVLGGSAVALVFVAVGASWLPARRAARADAVSVIRTA
jgi:putative ABC transport system permease protein